MEKQRFIFSALTLPSFATALAAGAFLSHGCPTIVSMNSCDEAEAKARDVVIEGVHLDPAFINRVAGNCIFKND